MVTWLCWSLDECLCENSSSRIAWITPVKLYTEKVFTVSLIFPSSSRSSYGSVSSVFCAGFLVPFSSFYDHLSFGNDAILLASLHFLLVCVLTQRWIFVVFICSMGSSKLLFKKSIQSSSSMSALSISSSVSFMKDMSLS